VQDNPLIDVPPIVRDTLGSRLLMDKAERAPE